MFPYEILPEVITLKYLERNTDDKDPLYVAFATLLPPNTSKAKISSSEPYYRTASAYIPFPFLRPSHSPTQNNRQNYSFVYLSIFG